MKQLPSRFLKHSIRQILLNSASSFLFAGLAAASPVGGEVTAGSATITGQGSSTVTVNQTTQRTVIDWQSFNTQSGESVRFNQPNSQSIALNRITNGSPTQFHGSLDANGKVIVINPNGIVFGNTSKIDVSGLIATTADIDTNNFMHSDRLVFDKPGNPNAAIVNQGHMTIKNAGLAAFVAGQVVNQNIIEARLGQVALASGDRFTLDLYGDGLVEVTASDAIQHQLVHNNGIIKADGGTIALTAAQAKESVDSLIVNTGVIQANAVAQKNGVIILYGEGRNAVKSNVATNKANHKGTSTVMQAGLISASGLKEGETGGTVKLLGDHVYLANQSITATVGDAGGGTIFVGGDYLGTGMTPTALTTYVAPQSLIFNQAVTRGNGGKTIIWSDNTTQFYGTIIGTGGALSGNGGFVETSGKINLLAQGVVDLTAAHGNKGSYLLDPNTITIYGNVDPHFISTDNTVNLNTNLKLWLDANDAGTVILSYSTSGLGVTANGSQNTHTITTSSNVAANLSVGARIRLNSSGSVTTADTMGSDTYTIASISGTTITTVESLSQNYTGSTLYRGLVSQWTDKASGVQATQVTESQRPLWISSAVDLNNKGAMQFFNNAQSNLNLTVDLNNAGGAYNSVFFNMNWTGTGNQMPLGFTTYDLWFGNAAGFGYNTGASNVYGINPTPLANSWHQVQADFFNGDNANNNLYIDNYLQTLTNQQAGIGYNSVTDAMRISGWVNDTNYSLNGRMGEIIIYDTLVSNDVRTLIAQYQAGKTGIGIATPGTGATEAERAMSATGFNVFTTGYLQHLSNTADIILQADHGITLDLQNDNLTLQAGRSLSLLTNDGTIHAVSGGQITTTQSAGTGGGITINAGGTGSVDLTGVTLSAQGNVVISAGHSVTLDSVTGRRVGITSGTGHDVTLKSAVHSTLAGNSMIIRSGRNFINQAGAGSLNAGAGRYLVYSNSPLLDTRGVTSGFSKRYNSTFNSYAPGSVTESGNLFLYSIAPQLTVTAQDATRPFNSANPTFTYDITGFIDGDNATNLIGLPNLTTSANAFSTNGTYAINASQGSLVSAQNYSFVFLDANLTVEPSASNLITQQAIMPLDINQGLSHIINPISFSDTVDLKIQNDYWLKNEASIEPFSGEDEKGLAVSKPHFNCLYYIINMWKKFDLGGMCSS